MEFDTEDQVLFFKQYMFSVSIEHYVSYFVHFLFVRDKWFSHPWGTNTFTQEQTFYVGVVGGDEDFDEDDY